MVSITLSLPEELKSEMEKFQDINWSAVAREAIKRKLMILRELDKLLIKSKITEEDAIELGRKVNKSLNERYKSIGKK